MCIRDRYEAHHRIKIPDEAIEAAVKLSVRYVTGRYLPDKAIDVIAVSYTHLPRALARLIMQPPVSTPMIA